MTEFNKSHRFRIKSGMTAAILSLATLWGGAALAVEPSTTSTQVNLNIASVLIMSFTPSSDLQLDFAQPSPAGTFKSTHHTLTIDTNATAGYEAKIKFSSDALNHTSISTPTTPTIPSTAGTLASPSTIETNRWGFALAPGGDNPVSTFANFTGTYADNNSANIFATAPTTDTTFANSNDAFAGGPHDYNFYYGAKVDTGQTAGTYATTITYTAVGYEAPCPFDSNLTATDSGCQECPYIPGIAIGDITCVEPLPPLPTPTEMAGLTPGYCLNEMTTYTGTNPEAILTLTDTRDNQPYQVAKLADGNCWMLNNLKLAPNITLTDADTDLNTISSFNFGGHNSLISDDSTGDFDTPYVYGPLNSTNSSDGEDYDSSDPTSDHFGGYLYNWSAATAGESMTSMPGDGTNNNIAPNSICPKNWHLPDETISQGLSDNWQGASVFRSVFAGFWSYGFGNQGSDFGSFNFWLSATYTGPGSSTVALYAYIAGSYFDPFYGNSRNYGLSIRCLLD